MGKTNLIHLVNDGGIPRWFVFLMTVVAGFSISNIYYIQPLLEDLRIELGCSPAVVNQITVVSQVGYVLGLFILVPLADKISRRRLLIFSFSILVVSLLVMSASSHLVPMIVSHLFIGFCAVMTHVFIPIATQYSTKENKSRNVGYILSGLLSGIILSRVVSGVLGELFSWRIIFVLSSVVMTISGIIFIYFLPDSEPNFKGSYKSLWKTLITIIRKHPKAVVCSLRAGFGMSSLFTMWACLAFHVSQEPFNGSSSTVSALSLCAIAGVITASNIGGLINKHGSRRFGYACATLHFTSWIIFLLGGYSFIGMIIGIIMIDMAQQALQISQQTVVLSLEPSASNRMNTIFMTIFYALASFGTFLSGIGWSIAGWEGVCVVGMIFSILSFSVCLYSQFILKYKD